jgi:iron complex transport system permease protein
MSRKKFSFIIGGSLLVLVLISLFSLTMGGVKLPPSDVLTSLYSFIRDGELKDASGIIVIEIRLARVLLAVIVGAALSLAGGIYQSLIRNPLGDPYILGVSSGAVLGSIIGISLGMGATFIGSELFSFAGGTIAIAIVYLVAKRGGRMDTVKLILAGVIISSFFSAAAMFIFSLSPSSTVRGMLFWMMGDLSSQSLDTILTALPYIGLIMIPVFLLSRPLSLMMVGEESALSLGVNVERVKKVSFLLASLLTGFAVSLAGAIGFVGLIIPNIVRYIAGADTKIGLPLSAIAGAGFLVLADTLARSIIAPTELPVGVITAGFGGPFFILLLLRRLKDEVGG